MLAGFLVVGGGLVAGYAALGDAGAPAADTGTADPSPSSPRSPTDGGSTAPGTVQSDLPAPVVPPCDGSFVLIVGSVTSPIGYQDAVVRLLDATPGATWFTTEGTCGSLRDRSDGGTLIHTVYLGPFRTAEAALASCGAGPPDAYVKRLDDGTGTGDGVVTCG
jgi:serine/threonine-protein kinase